MAKTGQGTTYDAVFAGAGLDALVAAAYLARAGRSVLVLADGERLGGAIGTDEISPGFRASSAWSSAELLHPSIVADLGLPEHGLELLPSTGGTFVTGDGGEPLYLPADDPASALAGRSRRDADAFRGFTTFLDRLAAAVAPALERPLPELEARGLGDLLQLLTLGFRLRRLGKDEMPEAMRYLPMPLRDVLDERFFDDALKAAIAAPGLRSSWLAPRSAGSALTLLLNRPAWTSGLLSRPVFPRGGMEALVASLASAARSAGVEIRSDAAALRLLHGDDGEAVGVVLADGEEIRARAVASDADPRRVLGELVDPAWLTPEAAFATKNLRGRGTVALVRYLVGELPRFQGAPTGDGYLAGRVQIGASLDELEQAFDPVKYGELPERPSVELVVPALTDPSREVKGGHVVETWVEWVPYDLAEGDWTSRREELGDLVTAWIEAFAPGFSSRVTARDVVTPADLEARHGAVRGSLLQVEPALDQLLFLRPMAGSYRYETPIPGLYLCGPGTHPGLAVSGLQGRNAAARMLENRPNE